MFDYLQYPFFQNALIGIFIISIAAAIIGSYIITRRMVAISGGITHACFGGLGLGYYLGVNPIAMATVFAIASSLGVEWLSTKLKVREDSAVAVVWAIGMAIGVVFVFLTPGYVPELNSFLFGNILNINHCDIIAFAVYTVILVIFFSLYYEKIIACAFDYDYSKVSGLPVRFISYSMTVLVAVCIVLTIRLVGIMLLMSMLSLPQMTAETIFRRFKPMVLLSVVVSLVCCTAGLFLAAYINVPCSAVIVIMMAVVFALTRVVKAIVMRR